MTSVSTEPPRASVTPASLALAVAAVVLVLAGIWVAGGVVTDDFRTSMALTALWFGVVVVAAVAGWRRAPPLRPAAVAAVATFVVAGGYLTYTSTVDTVVDEDVATGAAALEGSFVGLAHPTTGTARIVEQGDARVLTLTAFETDPGPDLFVYIVPSRTDGADVDGGASLGRLKGNVGDQQYELPGTLDLSDGATIVVWCRAFSVSFGAASLTET
jgi:hypothetical protein